MSSVLVGMFDTQAAAEAAHARLLAAGFSSSAVSMTGGMAGESTTTAPGSRDRDAEEEKGGIARFFDNLFGSDDNDVAQERGTYTEAFNRGSYGVSVTAADDSELDRAERVLNEAGAVDIDEKADEWRKSGWTGGTAAAGTLGAVATSEASGTAGRSGVLESGDSRKLQEVAEELKVGKRAVARGGVRIFTRIVERPVEETVRLREEHANVTRTAVDRPATEADFAAFKEGSIEVREMAEEAVVSKTARVTGEVEIGKTATEREETIRETVRETQVDVEQIDGGSPGGRPAGTSASALSGDANRDPLSGEPGSHPVGTGIGAAAGGIAAGAAVGTVAGPVGTVVGAAVGAVAGGLAGKGVAETIDPTTGKKSIQRL